jgi:ubiquinone/menaquinone biosynthesis C-methylase UbiE
MPYNEPNLWGATDTYERYMGRWSRKVAPLFLDWLNAPKEQSWIDIGCGTGELTSVIADKCSPAQLMGIDPSNGYIKFAKERIKSANFRVGDALEVGLPDNSTDLAVSGLVLNFVPDKQQAISEMVRIVRPEGSVALYVWDYAGHMQIMRYFFDAARQFDAGAAEYDDGIKAPICRPKPLKDAFEKAGLVEVETTAINIPTPFDDFDDYRTPFTAGTGSAPKYCALLDEDIRNKIKDVVRAKIPTGPDGEILLAARAWAVKGRSPH